MQESLSEYCENKAGFTGTFIMSEYSETTMMKVKGNFNYNSLPGLFEDLPHEPIVQRDNENAD